MCDRLLPALIYDFMYTLAGEFMTNGIIGGVGERLYCTSPLGEGKRVDSLSPERDGWNESKHCVSV